MGGGGGGTQGTRWNGWDNRRWNTRSHRWFRGSVVPLGILHNISSFPPMCISDGKSTFHNEESKVGDHFLSAISHFQQF